MDLGGGQEGYILLGGGTTTRYPLSHEGQPTYIKNKNGQCEIFYQKKNIGPTLRDNMCHLGKTHIKKCFF